MLGGLNSVTSTTTTVIHPFFRDYSGEPVPEENFWTLWCKGRLTEADTPTIRLGATPSGITSAQSVTKQLNLTERYECHLKVGRLVVAPFTVFVAPWVPLHIVELFTCICFSDSSCL